MKYIVSENQLKYLLEVVTNKEVVCDKCGWSWELEDGGNDPYVCHKCGHDNAEKK
jgi:tRNA(Ile2) C34 agmatinyltransferase TiaS